MYTDTLTSCSRRYPWNTPLLSAFGALLLSLLTVLQLSAAPINFSGQSITAYAPQDAGTHTVLDSGATLRVNGNAWKKIPYTYTITANTVISFDFQTTSQGEIHGIVLDNDANSDTNSNRIFQLYGTQTYGTQTYRDYSGSTWKTYIIPVGQHYTGAMSYLGFVNDHDVSGSTSNGSFRNVEIYENVVVAGGSELDFNSLTFSGYGAQDAGAYNIQDAGATVQLTGNAWKKAGYPMTISASTVIEFDFRSTSQGEIQGIVLDNDGDPDNSASKIFQLYGTQTYGNQTYRTYSGSGWVRFSIPVGQHYTGSVANLGFVNDHDVSGSTANGSFRNLVIINGSGTPMMSPFAIGTSGEAQGQFGTYASKLAAIGVKGFRASPVWQGVEPTDNNFNFSSFDGYVSTAASNGMTINGILAFSATWAATTQKHFPMGNLTAWGDYVGTTVGHYTNSIRYWEVWNEPNAGAFNSGNNSAYDYATLLRTAYNAAKAANPNCKVGLTIANFDVRYISLVIDSLAAQGAPNAFDFIAVHPYELTGRMNAPDGEIYYLNIVPALRQMLEAKAPSKVNVPIWLTELGAHLGDSIQGQTCDQNLQAQLLVKAYTLGIVQGIDRIQWFEAKDAGGSQNWGLMDDNIATERVAYDAYASMTGALGTMPIYQGWLALGSNGHGYGMVFTGAGGTNAMAAWMPKGETASISFGTTVQVVDIYTNTSTSTSAITLTDKPVFIKNLPTSMFNQAVANKTSPYPWGSSPVNANLARIDLGAVSVAEGVELDRAYTVTPNGTGTNGVIVNQVGQGLFLNVPPTFMDYNSGTVYVRVTAHQTQLRTSGYSGMNIFYQPKTGNATGAPQYPYANLGQWKGLANNLNSQTFTWTINNNMVVNTFGHAFYLLFDASVPFVVDRVEVSKVPF